MLFYISLVLLLFIFIYKKQNKHIYLTDEHVIITGGSSGIGLALGILASQKGANVTIIARSKERLKNAQEIITSHIKNKNQKVLIFSADVFQDQIKLQEIIQKAENESGPITFLINCAGTSVSYRFEETPLEDFSKMLNINYLGSVYITRIILPLMKQRKCGRIAFVSSLAGLVGVYGYTAYSASKFAILGLAEALQMETKHYGISITVSFPSDTDTPGFAEEIKNKPIETQEISKSGGLFNAEQVAAKILKDTMNKKFMSSIGFEGWMLCNLCSGMSPVNSLFDLFIQMITMGFFRLVGFIYLNRCFQKIKQCALLYEKNN